MWELLPETWRLDTTSISCCHDRRPRRGLVTDISLWIECFATLAAVLSVRYPDKVPQFMAYMHTIVCASWNFEGPAWATYGMAFRRQAANWQSLDWGSQCRYKYCRYAHLCARCSRPHPAADCEQRQSAQGPRSLQPPRHFLLI